jgi:hypothetical protein
MTQFITGTFFEAEPANRAVGEIIAAGRSRDDISIVMNGETYHRFWDGVPSGQTTTAGNELRTILAEAARRDAGATRGLSAGLPDRFLVAGPAALALLREGSDDRSGAGTVQRLARALGMPRNNAEQLERDVGSGGIAVGVKTSDGERATVERILRKHAARSVLESLTAS